MSARLGCQSQTNSFLRVVVVAALRSKVVEREKVRLSRNVFSSPTNKKKKNKSKEEKKEEKEEERKSTGKRIPLAAQTSSFIYIFLIYI